VSRRRNVNFCKLPGLGAGGWQSGKSAPTGDVPRGHSRFDHAGNAAPATPPDFSFPGWRLSAVCPRPDVGEGVVSEQFAIGARALGYAIDQPFSQLENSGAAEKVMFLGSR